MLQSPRRSNSPYWMFLFLKDWYVAAFTFVETAAVIQEVDCKTLNLDAPNHPGVVSCTIPDHDPTFLQWPPAPSNEIRKSRKPLQFTDQPARMKSPANTCFLRNNECKRCLKRKNGECDTCREGGTVTAGLPFQGKFASSGAIDLGFSSSWSPPWWLTRDEDKAPEFSNNLPWPVIPHGVSASPEFSFKQNHSTLQVGPRGPRPISL
ncbi:hypothetical protein O3P69_004012 [Scylla paramamosain]|uniref:Uncharacterized protein n=1 Tax=Scylla paramamosain TaxID=85552 RepID=A0AAW0UEH8_SCYPA